MSTRDPEAWMWGEACGLIEEAERLRQQFFTPGRSRTRRPTWAPPVDVLESQDELWILVALPGVSPDDVDVVIEGATLIVAGQRPMPRLAATSQIRRLEIPHGRFERRLELPVGRYEIARRDLDNGCLVLGLRKSG
jgi:HSP20 family protein